MYDGHGEVRWTPEFKNAWARFMIAEHRALVSRTKGILARALFEALPEESQEELDRMAEEDRRLALEGLVPLMNGEGETYYKHIDELEPGDVGDRLRAETALHDWLVWRTEERLEWLEVWRPPTRSRTD